MAFTVSGSPSSGFILFQNSTTSPPNRSFIVSTRGTSQIARAKKLSSRSGRFDSRTRKGGQSLQEQVEEEERERARERIDEIGSSTAETTTVADDGFVMPQLPGLEPDFWEGEKWDALGFFVQYMWGFGVLIALVACGVAVATYNDGATDFKDTPAYKESIQSKELLERPDAFDSDVFESNPTEEAPSLE